MAGLIQRTAQAIDDMWQSIWHGSSRAEKAVIAIVLLITGLAIPVIPIVWIARIIASCQGAAGRNTHCLFNESPSTTPVEEEHIYDPFRHISQSHGTLTWTATVYPIRGTQT